MKKKSAWLVGLILVFAFCFASEVPVSIEYPENAPADSVAVNTQDSIINQPKKIYARLHLAEKGLQWETFRHAWNGFAKLNNLGMIKNQILSIVDMSQPSTKKRLYIIDMLNEKLLVNTLVAHGKNSGENMASRFSNTPESLQSSLGFYVTGSTYQGGNGYSLKLKGVEKGFNDQAENRAIVMHGASYVSEAFVKSQGRLGRSWGCPAVSVAEHKQIINLVKNGSCLYVFAPQSAYLAQSRLSNDLAVTSL